MGVVHYSFILNGMLASCLELNLPLRTKVSGQPSNGISAGEKKLHVCVDVLCLQT